MTSNQTQSQAQPNVMVEREKIYAWVLDIPNPETREVALLELR